MQLLWYLPSLVVGLSLGIASGYWQLALVSVLMVSIIGFTSWIRNRYPVFDEKSEVSIGQAFVAIEGRVLPSWPLFWKKSWGQIFLAHFQSIAQLDSATEMLAAKESEHYRTLGKQMGLFLGVSNGDVLEVDLASEGPHLIILGPTGSGKSEFLHLLLTSMLASSEVELMLLDFKGGAALEEYSDLASGFATDLEPEAVDFVYSKISKSLISRELLLQEKGCSDIDSLRLSGIRIPRLVVVIDEFQQALQGKGLDVIQDLAARGRSLGVHLVCATQSLSGIPRSTLTNLRLRVVMESTDPIDMVQLGINPNRSSNLTKQGWAGALVTRSNQPAQSFLFPLGIRPKPDSNPSSQVNEPVQPARSQALRQMYSSPEPVTDLPEEQISSPDLQLLSRMEGLR
jgi:energy-coupling factor transporter ATP-binding protein EcfA2